MGISGLFKHLGSGKRTSLATLSAKHYADHKRPLRLAIDISIWLFQIQAAQGGQNAALRTFYYRLLRLISLNIYPLFVFDGPNKPLFKRNKKVGGPGVRVATVPEFLAKQLLKQFGFPMHIAPGEAEAECALLQREGVVDAVLSEDVDTIMFGSRLTLRSWTAEGSQKTPSHVNVYDAEILDASGLDCHGMVLVALMSGGDYIPEGIPKCGPKLAIDAAKAGFGTRLCAMKKTDTKQLAEWREELQMEFRTNASKLFSRRNTTLIVPDDFPNFEVMGYYLRPCVSSTEKVEELRRTLRWDQPLDLPALRDFAGDAFDWHNRGGAIKFIRNLSMNLLPQQLRLAAEQGESDNLSEQQDRESAIIQGIHNMRTHITVDNAVEMRISYLPAKLVPIDLSSEPVGDEEQPEAEDFDLREEAPDVEAFDKYDDVPQTPSRRQRTYRPYIEEQAEKIWVLREWVQLGCPAMLEDFEASLRVKQSAAKSSRPGVRKPKGTTKRGPPTSANSGMPINSLMRHVQAARSATIPELDDDYDKPEKRIVGRTTAAGQSTLSSSRHLRAAVDDTDNMTSSSQAGRGPTQNEDSPQQVRFRLPRGTQVPRTPRKRRTAEPSTPQSGRSAITSFFSPAPKRVQQNHPEVIDLLSSPESGSVRDRASIAAPVNQSSRTSSSRPNGNALRELSQNYNSAVPDLAAKRRQPRGPLQKSLSMPVSRPPMASTAIVSDSIECLDLSVSPAQARSFAQPVVSQAPPTRLYQPPSYSSTGTPSFDWSHSMAIPSVDLSGLTAPLESSRLRNEHAISAAVSGIRKATTAPLEPPKRSFIKIRESLDGAWTIASAETLDLSHMATSSTIKHSTTATKQRAKTWRTSGVDTLDLTGD